MANLNEVKEVLAILYIDQGLQIRHQEIQEFDDGNLFTKEQVMAMTKPLMEEIIILREELASKEEKIHSLKNNINLQDLNSDNACDEKDGTNQDSTCRRKCPKCGNDDKNMIHESIDKKNIISELNRYT